MCWPIPKPRLPKEVLRSAANKISCVMSKHYPKVASELPAMPNVHDLEPNQATEALLNHLDTLVTQCEEKVVLKKGPVADALKRARKILDSGHSGITKGPASVEDTDARFGHKSTTNIPTRCKAPHPWTAHVECMSARELLT